MRRPLLLLGLVSLLVASAAWAAITGGLYPTSERAFAYRAEYKRVAATSTLAAVTISGDSSRGSKNLLVRNDGPSNVYVSLASTTAATTAANGSLRLGINQSIDLADFYTTGISVVCAAAETASVEVLATY